MNKQFLILALATILFTACGNKTTAESPAGDTTSTCVDTVPTTNDEPTTATEPTVEEVKASVAEVPEPAPEKKVEKPKTGRCECRDCFAPDMETRVRCKNKGKLTKAGYRCETCAEWTGDFKYGGGCDGACVD